MQKAWHLAHELSRSSKRKAPCGAFRVCGGHSGMPFKQRLFSPLDPKVLNLMQMAYEQLIQGENRADKAMNGRR